MAIIDATGSACSKIGGVASALHDLAPRSLGDRVLKRFS
jgi:hypothetical protein